MHDGSSLQGSLFYASGALSAANSCERRAGRRANHHRLACTTRELRTGKRPIAREEKNSAHVAELVDGVDQADQLELNSNETRGEFRSCFMLSKDLAGYFG